MAFDMSRHLTWPELLRFVAPTIASMLFSSLYGIVDGLCVSNFAGKTAFAAVNFIMPIIMAIAALGFMVGSGGSAIVGKTRGEGDDHEANRQFSLFVAFAFAIGTLFSLAAFPCMRPIAHAMGGRGDLLDDAVLYGAMSLISMPFFMLQCMFQTFFVTAAKPRLGFAVTVGAGVVNIVGDLLLVGLLDLGVFGAALATNISEVLGGAVPVAYFARKNSSALRLVRPHVDWRLLGRACVNGSSEMMTNLAVSVVNTLYNIQLMAFAQENGVAAYGVVMYVSLVFVAVFNGYNVGASPLMSFQYGAGNVGEMQALFDKGLRFSIVGGIAVLAVSQALAVPIAALFGGYDRDLFDLTVLAFRFESFSFCLMGFAMFASALFTSLGNGKVSALVSFLRTIVFECSFVMLIPMALGMIGIWVSWPLAELASTVVDVAFVVYLGRIYGYLPGRAGATRGPERAT